METAERAWTVADVMVEDVVTAEPTTPTRCWSRSCGYRASADCPVR